MTSLRPIASRISQHTLRLSSPRNSKPKLTRIQPKNRSRMLTTEVPKTIEPTVASGVNLSPNQRTLVTSVLSLFAGHPTKNALAHWTDDATFADPLCIAEGRRKYEAQWTGLAALCSKIAIHHSEVVEAGNPIKLNQRVSYTVMGIGAEKTMQSEVLVYTTGEEGSMKITKVEDKWDGKLPDGRVVNALRKLNAMTVPLIMGGPKE